MRPLVTAKLLIQSTVIPGMNAVGTNTAASTSATPITGPVISLMAPQCGLLGLEAFVEVTFDGFDDHDRIVDDQSDGQLPNRKE